MALSVPKDGEGDTAIEVFDFEMNAVRSYQDRQAVVLERGDIRHFEMLQTPVGGDGKSYNRMIFYTERETNDNGVEQCRLYGLYLEPVQRENRELTFTVTKTAYDLVIPDGLFKVTYMGQTPYIYWVSAVPKQGQQGGKPVARVDRRLRHGHQRHGRRLGICGICGPPITAWIAV